MNTCAVSNVRDHLYVKMDVKEQKKKQERKI